MKNKEFQKLLRKDKSQSNSGFTLTELLTGLVMSIFVIGALGFGLMTVLRTTQSETSKVKARNENSRALDFISDEVRRARNIETNLTNARVTTDASVDTAFNVTGTNIDSATGGFNTNTTTTKKIVFALDIPEVTSSATLDADNNASTTNERIIYYLKSAGTNWEGPSVLYRWGPPLNADGSYGDGAWQEEALLDGINDTHITANPCTAGGTLTPPLLSGAAPTLSSSTLSTAATGFYACILNNGTGTNNNTAQLYLTGQTKTAFGVNDSQTNDSQVVARARTTLANQTNIFNSINWSIQGLGGAYNCTPNGTTWDMKTDFITTDNKGTVDTSDDTVNTVSWTQTADSNKQPQPVEIDPTKPLTITSSPINATDCISASASKSHTINFGNPTTFNGDCDNTSGACSTSVLNQPQVNGAAIQFFKKGYSIQNYGGYDANNDGVITIPYDADGDGTISAAEGAETKDQPPLGIFLHSKGLAIPDPITANPNLPGTNFKIPNDKAELDAYLDASSLSASEKAKFRVLGEDQRIVGFEMGQTDNAHPGFDLQDNIFLVTSSKFKEKFPPNCFPSGCPSP